MWEKFKWDGRLCNKSQTGRKKRWTPQHESRESMPSDNESVKKQGHMWVIIIRRCRSGVRAEEEMKWKSQCGDSWGGESVTLLDYTSVSLNPSESVSPHISVDFY